MSARSVSPEGALAFFDERADSYDRHYDHGGPNGYALRSRMAAVCAAIGPGSGAVLDAGMGGGRLCAELAALGWEPSGVDVAERMVDLARARLPDAADRFRVGRLEKLPFDGESFDVVVATGSLEYSDVPKAVAELARVLKPGGRAIVTYPNPYALYTLWKTRVYYTLVRWAKHATRRPHPELPRGFGVIPSKRFAEVLRPHLLELQSLHYTSFAPFLTPFDVLLPRLSSSVAQWLDNRQLAAPLFGAQIVYVATKDPR
jgi:SAM-dependent methyltransferase